MLAYFINCALIMACLWPPRPIDYRWETAVIQGILTKRVWVRRDTFAILRSRRKFILTAQSVNDFNVYEASVKYLGEIWPWKNNQLFVLPSYHGKWLNRYHFLSVAGRRKSPRNLWSVTSCLINTVCLLTIANAFPTIIYRTYRSS